MNQSKVLPEIFLIKFQILKKPNGCHHLFLKIIKNSRVLFKSTRFSEKAINLQQNVIIKGTNKS